MMNLSFQLKLRGSLTTLLFARAMSLPLYAWQDLELTEAKLLTYIQVDFVTDTTPLKNQSG
jgi:hypothetical protein